MLPPPARALQCCICQEDIHAADKKILACGHAYHRDCFADMMTKTGDTCAMCRKKVRSVEPKDIDKIKARTDSYHQELFETLKSYSDTYSCIKEEYADIQMQVQELNRYVRNVEKRLIDALHKAQPVIRDLKRISELRNGLRLPQPRQNPAQFPIWNAV